MNRKMGIRQNDSWGFICSQGIVTRTCGQKVGHQNMTYPGSFAHKNNDCIFEFTTLNTSKLCFEEMGYRLRLDTESGFCIQAFA